MPIRKLSEKITSIGNKGHNSGGAQNPPVKIIKMGSDVGATKNMTVYECGDDILVVDCGIGFPDADLPGVDVVIPDITYLLENKHKIKGILVTHGHEDHFGAIPYIIDQLNVPIYAHKLVQEFLKERLFDRTTKAVAESVEFHSVSAAMEELVLGNFKLTAFKVNHSVPDSLGFAINTPQGKILHMADFKIDMSPVLDDPIDLEKIRKHGEDGVLCLLSDCLLSTKHGSSESEKSLGPTYEKLMQAGEGKQIFVTTISTNISRMNQVIDVAIKHGRKIVFVGRSIDSRGNIARRLGYLPFADEHFVPLKKIGQHDPSSLLYIIAGCFGQENSALYKLAMGEHNRLQLEQDDLVIFSADPGPPSSYEPVENIQHYLTVAGAEIIYSDIQENLHVSGHGLREDLKKVAALSKSKYYIPIGGTAAKMRAYTHMVEELDVPRDNVWELLEGESVIFENGHATAGETMELKQVYIDGGVDSQIGEVVIRDRERLSDDGVFVVVVPVSKDKSQVVGSVEVVTRGFVYVKENRALVGRSKDKINKVLDKSRDGIRDWSALKSEVEKVSEKFLFEETGRKPLIIVSSISV